MRIGARSLCLAALVGLGACRPAETLRYPHETPETAVQAWADAFNRGETGQLRLLVHAERRDLFEEHTLDLKKQIEAFDIEKWALGEEVVVNEKHRGRAVSFWFHDGTKNVVNPAVVVFAEGRWWVWRY